MRTLQTRSIISLLALAVPFAGSTGVAADPIFRSKPKNKDVIAAPSDAPPGGSPGGVVPAPKGVGAAIKERAGAPKTRKPVDNAVSLVEDLKVVPSANNVVFTFNGPPNTVPILEIGRTAPGVGADGRWAFPPTQGNTAYPVGGDKAKGEYRVDIGFLTELRPNTTYYYILNARSHNTDPGAFRQQVKGMFTTVAQTVRITFTHLRVLNDSDPTGDGELTFVFWANAGDTPGGKRVIGEDPLDWGEGPHEANVVLEVPNAPDQLILQVDGFDDDSRPLTSYSRPSLPLTGPGANSAVEWNLARAVFDLTAHPGATASFPFTLYSVKNGDMSGRYVVVPAPVGVLYDGGTLGDLTFRAYGRVEIFRPLEGLEAARGSSAAPETRKGARIIPAPRGKPPVVRSEERAVPAKRHIFGPVFPNQK